MIDTAEPYLAERVFGPYSDQLDSLRYQYKHHLRPSGHSIEDIQIWIERNVKEWGLAPTAWAKKAGIAPSTLNRFLDKNAAGNSLSARTINRLSLVIDEEINNRIVEDWDDLLDSGDRTGVEINYADILGNVGQEQWNTRIRRSERALEEGLFWELRVPTPTHFGRFRLAAFEIRSDIHIPTFNKNDVLICAPICKYKFLPENNQFVIIIEMNHSRKWRAILKQFVIDPTGRHWLLPVGVRERGDEPAIFIDTHVDEADVEAKVAFAVIGTYRHTTPVIT